MSDEEASKVSELIDREAAVRYTEEHLAWLREQGTRERGINRQCLYAAAVDVEGMLGMIRDLPAVDMSDLLRDLAKAPFDMQTIMERENLAVTDHADPWQKMVFTQHSRLATLAGTAQRLLDEMSAWKPQEPQP